jgi:hypothetical protein
VAASKNAENLGLDFKITIVTQNGTFREDRFHLSG